jgi:hypothetical protein
MSDQEFEVVVEVFRTLAQWRDEADVLTISTDTEEKKLLS